MSSASVFVRWLLRLRKYKASNEEVKSQHLSCEHLREQTKKPCSSFLLSKISPHWILGNATRIEICDSAKFLNFD